MTIAPRLSILIVSYNCRQMLADTVDSIVAVGPPNCEVIIVENGSDGGARSVQQRHPQVMVIDNPQNTGFAAGNNLAFRHSRGEFVLLLNPDTYFLPDTAAPLSAFLEGNPRCGICGPRILDDEHRHTTNPCRAYDPGQMLADLVLRRLLRRPATPGRAPDTSQADFVHGSCMMVRRDVYEQLQGLDERLFMYCEEFEFSSRARDAGWETWYVAEAEVVHRERPTMQAGFSWTLPLRWHSALRVYRRHRSWLWMLGFRAAALGHVMLDAVTAVAQSVVGLQWSRIGTIVRGYLTVMLVLVLPVDLGARFIPRPSRG